jgi:glycosyltransferase involved in cell wall biosynthesis
LLRLTAIIAVYNEADIIGQSVSDLVRQGIRVHVLDNHSTDGTLEALSPFLDSGLVEVERFPAEDAGPNHLYEHARIMARKQQLARELDADWFISHDADEFRESPWAGLTFREGVERVNRFGYNAIDFAVLNFQPTHDGFTPDRDVRDTFPYFELAGPWDRTQIKCWKKVPDVELVSSGGHDATFASRRVFPIRFLLRHYPIRGQAQGERKVFRDRKHRFALEDIERGWHVQYDQIREGHQFIRSNDALSVYDPEQVRLTLMLQHRGVEDLEAAIARAGDELAHAREQLTVLDSALESSHADLQRVEAEASVRDAEARASALEVDRQARELERMSRSIHELRHELDRQSSYLADLLTSKSWRITQPLRAAYDFTQGLSRRLTSHRNRPTRGSL